MSFLIVLLGVQIFSGEETPSRPAEETAEMPKTEPEMPKIEPEIPKTEPDAPKIEPEIPKTEPDAPKIEPEIPKTETPKMPHAEIVLYRLDSGSLASGEVPLAWQDFACEEVLRSEKGKASITLANYSVIEFDGVVAIGKEPNQVAVIDGRAEVKLAPDVDEPMRFVQRAGVITGAKNACFEIVVQELPAQELETAQAGDNSSEMKLRVLDGEVQVQRPGFQALQLVSAGEERTFVLGAVRREGSIQALGFGRSDKKGRQGKAWRERGARTDAARCLAEFAYGMQFQVQASQDRFTFEKAVFEAQGEVTIEDSRYEPLSDDVTMCFATASIPLQQAVERRNFPQIQAQGGTLADLHKNLPQALQSARNNAILMVIRQSAQEIYGIAPSVLSGTFYPDSFGVSMQGNEILATVTGQVVFD